MLKSRCAKSPSRRTSSERSTPRRRRGTRVGLTPRYTASGFCPPRYLRRLRQGRPLRRPRTWAPPGPGGRGFSRAFHSWTHSLGSTRRRSLRLRGSDSASAVPDRREQLSSPQQQLRALLRVVSARRTSQRAGREGARTAPTIRTRHQCSSCRVARCFCRFELLELTWTACSMRLDAHCIPTKRRRFPDQSAVTVSYAAATSDSGDVAPMADV